MNAVRHRPIVFTVVSLLVISFVYSSISTPGIFALPPDPNWDPSGTCGAVTTNPQTGENKQTCCWKEIERGPYPKIETREVSYCQTCSWNGVSDCKPKVAQARLPGGDLPQLETVPPIRGLPSGGDVPTLEQVPPPGLQPGSDLPTLEEGPGFNQGTEGEPPLPVVCSEEAGLEKDPETGQCVPIESPVTEEQPEEAPEEQQQPEEEEEQSEPEEEQSSEESDSGDESNN